MVCYLEETACSARMVDLLHYYLGCGGFGGMEEWRDVDGGDGERQRRGVGARGG